MGKKMRQWIDSKSYLDCAAYGALVGLTIQVIVLVATATNGSKK